MNCLPSWPSSQTAEAVLVWKEAWPCPAWLEKLFHSTQTPSAGAQHSQWEICFKSLRWDGKKLATSDRDKEGSFVEDNLTFTCALLETSGATKYSEGQHERL